MFADLLNISVVGLSLRNVLGTHTIPNAIRMAIFFTNIFKCQFFPLVKVPVLCIGSSCCYQIREPQFYQCCRNNADTFDRYIFAMFERKLLLLS
jgi:hypothetical protein